MILFLPNDITKQMKIAQSNLFPEVGHAACLMMPMLCSESVKVQCDPRSMWLQLLFQFYYSLADFFL